MGGQRLSPDGRDLHHRRRRRGRPGRCTAVVDRRHRAVRARVADHCARACRLRGGRRPRAAGARRRVCGGRHACGGERSRARHGPRGGDRHLERIPDARLQHRAARRRRRDAFRGLALHLLAERCRHGARRADAVAASWNWRPAHGVDGLDRPRRARRLHGDADHGIAGAGACPQRPKSCHRPAGAGRDRFRWIDLDGDAPPSAAGRPRPVREPEFCDLPPGCCFS